ncbi:MAG: aldo/keto reductase [Phocaeicola dorei]|nr:aldo/keto reductase [Phocaeicola dorei]
MKQKLNNEERTEMSRRGFLKRAALTGAAICVAPALETVTAAERAITGESSGSETTASSLTGMASISTNRTLGSGSAAMEVSAMGFGCMGMSHNRGLHPGEKEQIALIREAIDRGVTFLDTAESYGPYKNEILVGKALKDGYANRTLLATKFGHKYINGKRVADEEDSSPASIRRVCDESLQRLGIDHIDLFYQHRADPNTPPEVVAETVGELIKAGKVRHFGMCEVSVDTIRRAHAVCPITAIQSEYSLMFRNVETNGVLDVCRELGIGFVPYSPINRGFLGGSINEHTVFDPVHDNRQSSPRFQPEAIRANTRIVNVLQQFGHTRGLTSAQVALAWLMSKRPYIVPIPGTTKLSHLEENLRAATVRFTAEEMKELEDAVAAIPVVGERYSGAEAAKIQN